VSSYVVQDEEEKKAEEVANINNEANQ